MAHGKVEKRRISVTLSNLEWITVLEAMKCRGTDRDKLVGAKVMEQIREGNDAIWKKGGSR